VRKRLYRVLVALIGALMVLLVGTPGAAQATDTPPPDATAIQVTLQDEANKDAQGNPKPISGVTLEVSKDGEKAGEGVTDADGVAIIIVEELGTYTVTLDEDTLPEGTVLDEGTKDTATVHVRFQGPNNRAIFPIGVTAGEKSSFAKDLAQNLRAGIVFALVLCLAALGFTLVFGTTGLSNFSHGEMLTFGAVMAWTFDQLFKTGGLATVSVILAGVIAVVLGGLGGYVQDKVLWGPLRRRGTGLIAMMIVSIGLSIFLRYLYQYFYTSSTRSLSQYSGQQREQHWYYLGLSFADREGIIVLISIVTIVSVGLWLAKSRMGKAMRAVSDNPALAASSGLRVDSVITNAWVMGGALTALSGVLYALTLQVNAFMGMRILLVIFAAVTLGGLGTIWGSLVGSLVIGLVYELGPLFGVPSSIKEVGPLLIMIVILLVRPQGILGRKERLG
jgi:branched-subunit amino acid ABC-type transport system permease component